MTEKTIKKLTPDELIEKRKKALSAAIKKKSDYLNRKALRIWTETKSLYFEHIDEIFIPSNLEYFKEELKKLLKNLPKGENNG